MRITFDRAYQIAQGGDTVSVSGGLYPASDASAPESDAPANTIYPASPAKSSAVTFNCQGNGDVTFDAPNFAFFPGANGVTFTGNCFKFNAVVIGYGGYPAQTHDITLDGVHMSTIECNGCANITIKNSDIGAMISCYAPGTSGVASSAICNTSDTTYGESYWASHGGSTKADSTVAFCHYGAAGLVQNITLDHDTFHDFNTRDSQHLHIECLFLWGFNGITLTNSTFHNCATYDIFMSTEVTSSNLTLTGNTFGPPVWDLDETNGTLTGTERDKDWRDITVYTQAGSPLTNWQIQGNTFSHGLMLDTNNVGTPIMNGVTVSGNNLGSNTKCASGVTYQSNTGSGPAC